MIVWPQKMFWFVSFNQSIHGILTVRVSNFPNFSDFKLLKEGNNGIAKMLSKKLVLTVRKSQEDKQLKFAP